MAPSNSTGPGVSAARGANSTLTEEPVTASPSSIPTGLPDTSLDIIKVATRVFQQSAANLQAAIEKAGLPGVRMQVGYVSQTKTLAFVITGIFECQHCHLYSIGDHCQHCDAGRKAEP